jgi:hypothetical protein
MKSETSSWSEFQKKWDGNVNFLMSGECIPFEFKMPSLQEVISQIRNDPDARITPGIPGSALILQSIADEFRAKSIEEVIKSKFTMAHFKLSNFYKQGQLFYQFEERVMEPWKKCLARAGFTWDRCYPILFISGAGCSTNYHMDQSHVVAWQMYGTKTFNGFKNPEARAPFSERMSSVEFANQKTIQPNGMDKSEVLSFVMQPGTVLWNTFLTPHWVEASEGVSYSINLSHGGLRFQGKLCKHEEELQEWRKSHEAQEVKAY